MTASLAKITALIARVLLIVGGVAIILMTLHTLADITARFFFRSPLPGTLEIATHYYLVPITFLPLAAVELRREHIVVEAFTHFLADRWNAVLDVVVRVICIVCLVVFAWRTGVEAIAKTAKAEFYSAIYFQVPIWPVRWLLPISFAAFALAMLSTLLESISSRGVPRDRENLAPEI